MTAAIVTFTRGLADTIIISSRQEQRMSTTDYSLLRDFSFSVVSFVLSTTGTLALDSLLALPMEDWHFVFTKLKDGTQNDETTLESRLILEAAGQGFWWRQGGDYCFQVISHLSATVCLRLFHATNTLAILIYRHGQSTTLAYVFTPRVFTVH